MKTICKWSMTALLVAGTLALGACGGGGGGGGRSNSAASQCAGNSDTFICEVFKVVNNLTSETADPREIDSIAVTSPEDTDPTSAI